MVQGSFPIGNLDEHTWVRGDNTDIGYTMPEGLKNWKMARCIWYKNYAFTFQIYFTVIIFINSLTLKIFQIYINILFT